MRLPRLHKARVFIKDLLTSKDGVTYAPSRVYWLLGSLTQIALSVWAVVVLRENFNSTDFGTGMGLILTAGGVGVWLTRKTEPDVPHGRQDQP
jgi:hypothetical protein